MGNKKLKDLTKLVEGVSVQIQMIEEEYSFLLKERSRYHETELAKMVASIVGDKLAPKFLGEKFVAEMRDSMEKILDNIPVESSGWTKSFKDMTDELISLHEAQIRNYKKLEKIVLELQKGEFIEKTFEEASIRNQYKETIESYEDMILLYKRTYKDLKDLNSLPPKKK